MHNIKQNRNPNNLICKEFLKFWNPIVFCLLACLPAVRPTSSGRIGPVLLHNVGYQHATEDLLIQLRFTHCVIVSHFFLHCFSFALTGTQNVRNHWRGVDELYSYTYYVTLMAKCMSIWLHHPLKILPSTKFLQCTDSSQPGWLHVETCMRILGL